MKAELTALLFSAPEKKTVTPKAPTPKRTPVPERTCEEMYVEEEKPETRRVSRRQSSVQQEKAPTSKASSEPVLEPVAKEIDIQEEKLVETRSLSRRQSATAAIAPAAAPVFEFGASAIQAAFSFSAQAPAVASTKTPVTTTPSEAAEAVPIASKIARPAFSRSASTLKEARARKEMAKHKERLASKRKEREEKTGKIGAAQEQRKAAHVKTAGKRPAKDWDAIHARAFAKQESLTDHVKRKKAEKAKGATPRREGTVPTPSVEPVTPAPRRSPRSAGITSSNKASTLSSASHG
jgi:hypothetical protein